LILIEGRGAKKLIKIKINL